MRIDSHQHFWNYDPERESWIPDTMAVIRKDFLPIDLKPVLEKNNIDGCVVVQADESEEESQFLLELAAKNAFIKGVVGWVDLCAENSEERLSYYAENPLFKGIRYILQAKKDEFILSPQFQKGIAQLEKFNLSYDLLVLERQLPTAIALVKKFPKQRFVLDHLAKPQISNGVSAEWENNIRKLGSCANVYCKLSGLLTETDDFKWKPEDFTPFLEIVFQAFGEDRLLFGSDWPVCLSAGKYEDALSIIEHYFATKSELALEKIMGQNAINFYRLC